MPSKPAPKPPATTAPKPVKLTVLVHGKPIKTVSAIRGGCCIDKKGASQ